MMGHASLKMITDKYFSYIPNMMHQDGSKFLEEYCKKVDVEKVGNEKGRAKLINDSALTFFTIALKL
jgi:hypothetical protein